MWIESMISELFGVITRNKNDTRNKYYIKENFFVYICIYLISDPISEARRIIDRACALLIFFILSLLIDNI